MVSDLNVVVIGGGCGAVQVLSGLQRYTQQLTAIIATTDTGRSSGKVRALVDMPAPGDLRSALSSLARDGSILPQLMEYRLKIPDFEPLDGVAFGNLMIAALTQFTGSFATAITIMHEVLKVPYQVIPITDQSTNISARLTDDTIVTGEFNIRSPGKPPIKEVFLADQSIAAYQPCVAALRAADLIVVGPGGLFTSVIACLLFPEIAEAIRSSHAKVVYVCNNTTQPGQTDGYTAYDHIAQITRYLGPGVLHYAVVNTAVPDEATRDIYEEQGIHVLVPTAEELERIRALGVTPILFEVAETQYRGRNLWQKQDTVRHDPTRVAEAIITTVFADAPSDDLSARARP